MTSKPLPSCGMPELLPCPFCGAEGELYEPNEDIAVISCTGCNAESGYYGGEDSTTPDDAIKFWNTRATPDDVAEVTLSQWEKMCDGHYGNTYSLAKELMHKYPNGLKIISAEDGKGGE